MWSRYETEGEKQMKEFIMGFLVCWVLLGIFEVVSEKFDWYYKDWHWWITGLPVLIVIVPIGVLGMIIFKQWQNVVKPVEKKRWDDITTDFKDKVKYIHIGRFYICFEPKARFINKLFFIRVKK